MPEAGVLRGKEFRPTGELLDRSRRAASGLASFGVGPDDTFCLLLRNDFALFEASYAAWTLGATAVPVNWHGTGPEVAYVVKDSGAKVLIAHADLLPGVADDIPEGVQVICVPTPDDIARTYDIAPERQAVPDGLVAWDDWVASFEPSEAEPPEHAFPIIYTSGTTGAPKGVRRLPTPGSMAGKEELMAAFGTTTRMRTVVTGPMYHSAPNGYGLSAARLDGFVVLQTRFDAEELLELIDHHRITHLHMVPTMFVRLLRLPEEVREKYDVSSLVNVTHAAAPCPPDVKRAMIEWWGPVLHEYYGATETGIVTACDSEEWLAHPGTVGKPISTATIRIYDDDGNELPPGEPGEVFMWNRDFADFTYEGRPEARREVERDGLVTAGDVGYLDEDGFLHLCDRKRDMVISGGVNIYPVEIERCLLRLEGVKDCAVFGIPDQEFGESLAAAVEVEPGARVTAADVQAHVRRELAAFKVPKVVTFHDELPREDSGKIFKRKLRQPYWDEVGRAI